MTESAPETPTTFEQIIGHEDLLSGLVRMDAANRVPGGLLLHGAAGRGKRTIALAFARRRLSGPGEGPDLRAAPSDLTVVQRDPGVRQLSIDAIRRLRETFALTPAEAPGRVAVIVDADRLTVEAGNALLKLLEEPPPRALLILTARGRESVMETLVSRCHVHHVGPLSLAELERHLAGHGVAPDLAARAARLAEGSPGKALGLAATLDDAQRLGLLARLLDAPADPFAAASALTGALKEKGGKLEEARERLRDLLELAIQVLRLTLRAALKAPGGAEAIALLPPALSGVLGDRHPRAVRSSLEACLEARADLDRNMNIELLLEDLLPRLGARV